MNDCRDCFYQFNQQHIGGVQHYCERFDRMLQVSKAGKVVPYRPCSWFWFKNLKEVLEREQNIRRTSEAANGQTNNVG